MMAIKHVVSVSGGKDSTATLLIALERFGRNAVVPIFCDTGNEHDEVHQYLDYLERRLGISINRLRASFNAEIAAKRMFIARDCRTGRKYQRVAKTDRYGRPVYERNADGSIKLVPVYELDEQGNPTAMIKDWQAVQKMGWDGGRKVRWTNKAKRRSLALLKPTGNPFLDLCLWKGRFPSRKGQFCTEQLKRNPAVEFQLELVDVGHTVVSWQGVRRDESPNRRDAKKFERVGPGLYVFRPIVEWTAAGVFAHCAARAVAVNQLYRMGMSRVGCMPCINANKAELREIASRFPDEIARIAEWEKLVGGASKRQAATFIPAPGITPNQAKDHGIFSVIQWAKTTRGGKQYDLLADLVDNTACASAYGLCE